MAKLIDITGKCLSGEWGQDDNDGTGIPVLRTTNFTNDGVVSYASVVTRQINKRNLETKYLRNGDIIIEKSGGSDNQPVGRVVYFEGEENKYLFNNFTGLLRVENHNMWIPKYVFYALFANYHRGGTRPFENKTTGLHNLKTDSYLSSVEIRDVSYDEQCRIVDQLDKIAHLISLRKQQVKELDNLVKSRFIELFGDPIENPLGWKKRYLLEMGYCKNGMNFHTGDFGIDLHCLGVGDFKNLSVISNTESLPTISLNELPQTEYMLRDGDIVFVRSNGNKALVGRCVIVYPGDTPTTYSGFCIRYRLTDESLNPNYLLRVLKTESMRKKMAGRGANIQNLNQQILASLAIPLPPIELQNEYAAFVEQTDKLKYCGDLEVAA